MDSEGKTQGRQGKRTQSLSVAWRLGDNRKGELLLVSCSQSCSLPLLPLFFFTSNYLSYPSSIEGKNLKAVKNNRLRDILFFSH